MYTDLYMYRHHANIYTWVLKSSKEVLSDMLMYGLLVVGQQNVSYNFKKKHISKSWGICILYMYVYI